MRVNLTTSWNLARSRSAFPDHHFLEHGFSSRASTPAAWTILVCCLAFVTAPASANDPVGERLGLTKDSGSLPIWEQPTTEAAGRLSDQARRVSPSIMIIGHPNGGYGTGFVVSREHRLVATNAHVADIEYQAGNLLAIPNGSSQVFRVDEVWYHPGLIRQNQDGQQFRTADPAIGDVFSRSPDVAVLHIAGNEELPEALALAHPDEIADLFAASIAMIGFPGHDTVHWPGIGEKAQATYREGVIARVTDFDNDANADPRDTQFLQHTMANWFGFSGSPMFLANGRVAALNNSAHSFRKGGLAVTIPFGIRVDCLWELLVFHQLDQKLSVPISYDELRLNRFEGEDPRIENYKVVEDLKTRATALSYEGTYNEAASLLNQAIRRMPNDATAHSIMAEIQSEYALKTWGNAVQARRAGQLESYTRHTRYAVQEAKKALQLDPADVSNILSLVTFERNLDLISRGPHERPQDRQLAAKVLELQGLSALNRSTAYSVYAQGYRSPAQSVPWLTKAIEAAPFFPVEYENRAVTYDLLGQSSRAAADRRRAQELRTAAAASMNAWRLATSPEAAERDGAEALRLADQACRLTSHKNWVDLSALAAAYAEVGNFDEAVRWETESMRLAPDNAKSAVARRLRHYRDAKPLPHRITKPQAERRQQWRPPSGYRGRKAEGGSRKRSSTTKKGIGARGSEPSTPCSQRMT